MIKMNKWFYYFLKHNSIVKIQGIPYNIIGFSIVKTSSSVKNIKFRYGLGDPNCLHKHIKRKDGTFQCRICGERRIKKVLGYYFLSYPNNT